ncbi:LOW QUALITY PROTEIN: serpin B9-like [Sturnira hondurensis]|uniref:LOW QUALITY PROTEIN: serpin B9-like n=1 Tax=Sturnira hondurensis TaxID=192404 RepID=UPI001879CA11|nr:LOW QUALITY PROTEIN: serpin B9-like [Sturnira hondurensis]
MVTACWIWNTLSLLTSKASLAYIAGNVFFLALSSSSALAMVFVGTKGNTTSQMAQVFSLNTEKDIHVVFQSLFAEGNKPGSQDLLRSANRLFAEKTREFLPTFKELCRQFCQAELEQLSFAKAAEKSRKHISTWDSQMTGGKIRNLLPETTVDEQTRLVVVNAVCFKGRWSGPLEKTCTKEMPFKISWKDQRTVQTMFQEAMFKLASIEEIMKAQVLELPCEGEELSMLILLPDHNVDLSLVEKELTFERFISWTNLHHMMCTEVEIFLPRFKLEGHYNMESVLQHLGIVDAFQVGKANFSAMSAEEALCLSKFVHKAFMEVNEDVTEAAATSHTEAFDHCLENAPRFCAHHPFLFFIGHNKANCILFCGKFSSL